MIVEFSDFECPFCGRFEATLAEVARRYGDRVRLVYREFPLPMHRHAEKAAEAALCAGDQGKFWEMHDLLFESQSDLEPTALERMAARLGLSAGEFSRCLDSGRHAADVAADVAAGTAAGVRGTPAMFVNGRFLAGAVPIDDLAHAVDRELAAGVPAR